MKKLLLLSGLMVAALGAYAQGTVNFANGAAGVDAPITNATVSPSVRADSGFRAQLYVGPAGATTGLTTNGVSGAPATLLGGGGAGYFLGNARDITGFAPGTVVTLQVRAWQASAGGSWEAVGPGARGESNLIQVSLGGGTIPTPNMLGLQGFAVGGVVPEPSSIALGLLGLGAIVLFRRRK
jgi:hypothetical protein